MRDNPREGELDSADDVRRRCKKNSPCISSCIEREKKALTAAAEVEKVYSGQTGEGPGENALLVHLHSRHRHNDVSSKQNLRRYLLMLRKI